MKKSLYLGLDGSQYKSKDEVICCPIIKIAPYPFESKEIEKVFRSFSEYTHIVFTSKTTVKLVVELLRHYGYPLEELNRKVCIAIGKATATLLQSNGVSPLVAEQETTEGIIELLDNFNIENAFLFWPHSALSRSLLKDYFIKRKMKFRECVLYTTEPQEPEYMPNIYDFDEIIFTSPSTVEAYIRFFGPLPRDKSLIAIGPITKKKLDACQI